MDSLEKVRLVVNAALDKKAVDPAVFFTQELTDLADYVVIASGTSDRHVRAVADGIEEALGKAGEKPMGVEGASEGRWVLIDAVDVIVHIFHQPVREFYGLERLWMDAPRLVLTPAGGIEAPQRAAEAHLRR